MDRRGMVIGGILLFALAARAAAPLPPDGQLVDLAGVLDAPSVGQLRSTLSAYVDATGLELRVVTVGDLQNESLADYASRLLQARVAVSPVVGLLVWAPPQQLAIAASPPYAAYFTAEQMQQALDAYALPSLREGQTTEALVQTVFALMVAAVAPADPAVMPAQPVVMVTNTTPSIRRPSTQAPPVRPNPASPDAAADEAQKPAQADASAPAEGLAIIWHAAGVQARALLASLRDTGEQLDAHFSGKEEMHPDRLLSALAGLVAAAFVLFVAVRLWLQRRQPGMALSIVGLAAAATCWLLAGYGELALLLALAGPLLWGVLRVLPIVLARADQERLPATAMGKMPGMASSMPQPGTTTAPRWQREAAAPPRATLQTPPERKHATARRDRPKDASPRGERHGRPEGLVTALQRARRDGIRTPALDHLVAQKGQPVSPQRRQQRRNWLIALFICFFVALPLVLFLLIAWALSELNQIKPAKQTLPDFVRQLMADFRAVAHHQRPRA